MAGSKRYWLAAGVLLAGAGGAVALAVQPHEQKQAGGKTVPANGVILVANDAALKAALAKVSNGDVIRLRPGSYVSLDMRGSPHDARFVVESADPGAPATIDGFNLRDVHGMTLRNLKVTRDAKEKPRQQLGLIRQSGNVTIDNVTFAVPPGTADRGREYGLILRDVQGMRVVRSSFSGLRYGVGILNASGVSIEYSEFFDLQTDGIRGGGASDLTIVGNVLGRFSPLEKEHPDGIQLWSTNQTEAARNISIRDNLVVRDEGGITQGIFVRDTNSRLPFEKLEITGNLAIGTMFNGISVQGVDGATITGNRVVAFRDQRSWIRVQTAQRVDLSANQAMMYVFKDAGNARERGNRRTGAIKGDNVAPLIREWLQEKPELRDNPGPYLRSLIGGAGGA